MILRMMDDLDGVDNRYNNTNRPKARKFKDPDRKPLLAYSPQRGSLREMAIDIGTSKRP